MLEAKISHEYGTDVYTLTDGFKEPIDWNVDVYDKGNQRRIQFNTECEMVNYPLSDVIEFLQSLEEKK